MPDNSAYMYAAYVLAAVLYGGYVASLWLRARSARMHRPQLEQAPAASSSRRVI